MKIEGLNIGVRMAGLRWKAQTQRPQGLKDEQAFQQKEPAKEQAKALSEQKVQVGPYRAYFAIDENNNVVIRVVDEEGKLIRQIPPEEYVKMKEALRETIKNLLNLEV